MMGETAFVHRSLAPGTDLYVLATRKFKRARVSVFVHDVLDPDRVALGALLPFVQKRGTKSHPTGMDLERAAGRLYDATISGGVHKFGDRQTISYSLEVASDRYVGEPVLNAGLALLREVIYEPVEVDGGFSPEYVEQEKRFQVGRVRALVNDKIRYANFRCVEEMFKGQPYAQYELGTEEAIERASAKALREHHRELLKTRPIDIYVVGDVDPERVYDQIAGAFAAGRGEVLELRPSEVGLGEGPERVVTQEEPMKQGWLVLGMRTDIRRSDPLRYGLQFFNGILGGFVHSKLFINVREKASLAYSAFSSYDANKGLILAYAGIDVNKYDQALEIIKRQIRDTAEGRFSDEEFDATLKGFETQYRMRLDSINGMILHHLGGKLEGCPESIDESLEKVAKVTKEDVIEAARRTRLDTVYFLKGVN